MQLHGVCDDSWEANSESAQCINGGTFDGCNAKLESLAELELHPQISLASGVRLSCGANAAHGYVRLASLARHTPSINVRSSVAESQGTDPDKLGKRRSLNNP